MEFDVVPSSGTASLVFVRIRSTISMKKTCDSKIITPRIDNNKEKVPIGIRLNP